MGLFCATLLYFGPEFLENTENSIRVVQRMTVFLDMFVLLDFSWVKNTSWSAGKKLHQG